MAVRYSMYSNANVYGGDVLHGPYMVSKEPVYVAAGSDLSFEWRAQGGATPSMSMPML